MYKRQLYPVGRLDYDSRGLMFLTNDGDFAYKLTHPKFEIPKTYEIILDGEINEKVLDKIRDGVYICLLYTSKRYFLKCLIIFF